VTLYGRFPTYNFVVLGDRDLDLLGDLEGDRDPDPEGDLRLGERDDFLLGEGDPRFGEGDPRFGGEFLGDGDRRFGEREDRFRFGDLDRDEDLRALFFAKSKNISKFSYSF